MTVWALCRGTLAFAARTYRHSLVHYQILRLARLQIPQVHEQVDRQVHYLETGQVPTPPCYELQFER